MNPAICAALVAALDAAAALTTVRCARRVHLSGWFAIVVMSVGAVLQALLLGRARAALPSAVMLGIAAFCAITDAQTGYVFDALTIPGTGAALFASIIAGRLPAALEGGAAAGAALLLLHLLTRGRGLGLGDVKLACCIGAGLSLAGGLHALQYAFVLGGAYAAVLLLARKARAGARVRFAPFLFAGAALSALQGAA